MRVSLEEWGVRLAEGGVRVVLEAPGQNPVASHDEPRARVVFHSAGGVEALRRADPLGLAEAFLDGRIDVDGDLREVLKLTRIPAPSVSPPNRWLHKLRVALPGRRAWNRRSIAFHYDRPAEFFLPWLDRWRSYSHGFYASDCESAESAQARKLQYAIDALDLAAGDCVLDVGCGWGSFLEYAGRQGVRVHGITISREQYRFVSQLIDDRALPCSVEFVDFFSLRPDPSYEAAVFMGSLEHLVGYRRVARIVSRQLRPGGRVYADFCAQERDTRTGIFLSRHAWPGAAAYVYLPGLVKALAREGLHVQQVADDTSHYARSVRDWADALERERTELAESFGEISVRTFLLMLRGSQEFFETRRTLAYHIVAADGRKREPGRAIVRRAAP